MVMMIAAIPPTNVDQCVPKLSIVLHPANVWQWTSFVTVYVTVKTAATNCHRMAGKANNGLVIFLHLQCTAAGYIVDVEPKTF